MIELDGGHHARDEIAAGDLVRQRWLEAQGYRVLRFWNAEIASNLDGVLETIYAAMHGQPQLNRGTSRTADVAVTTPREHRAPTLPGRGRVGPQRRGGVSRRQRDRVPRAAPGCASRIHPSPPTAAPSDPPPPGEGGR